MHNTPSLGPVETDTSEAYASRSQTEWAISLMGLHTVLHTYKAVACSAVSGGCCIKAPQTGWLKHNSGCWDSKNEGGAGLGC